MRNRSPDRKFRHSRRIPEPRIRCALAACAIALVAAAVPPPHARGADDQADNPADDSPAERLAEWRRKLDAQQATLVGPALEEYRRALAELEAARVKARDYPAAIEIQRERRAVETRLARLATGTPVATTEATAETADHEAGAPDDPDSGRILLAAEDASTGGGVTFDDAAGALVGWDSEGAFAEWELPSDLPQGGWEIEVTYASGSGGSDGAAGAVRFQGSFYTLTRTPEPTGGEDSFEVRRIGTLRLRAGSPKLRVEAVEAAGAPLWRLRSIRLLAADRDHP